MAIESRTPRLRLVPLDLSHRHAVFSVYSDERTWRHLPSGRHSDIAQSERMIRSAQQSWASIGLGSWAVFLATAEDADGEDDAFVGVGGVDLLDPPAWNIGYRLAPRWWGRGFAPEISHAAHAAALRTNSGPSDHRPGAGQQSGLGEGVAAARAGAALGGPATGRRTG